MDFKPKRIFVTVGSTEFDELIKCIDTEIFHKTVFELGCVSLVMQIGRGNYVPRIGIDKLGTPLSSVEYFRYKPTLSHDMQASDMIIAHAGAGSIIESLRMRKRLLVVVNSKLMGNHQSEIAIELEKDGYLTMSANASSVLVALLEACKSKVKPYPLPNKNPFHSCIEDLIGVNPSCVD